jgi:hypothetical protein
VTCRLLPRPRGKQGSSVTETAGEGSEAPE